MFRGPSFSPRVEKVWYVMDGCGMVTSGVTYMLLLFVSVAERVWWRD